VNRKGGEDKTKKTNFSKERKKSRKGKWLPGIIPPHNREGKKRKSVADLGINLRVNKYLGLRTGRGRMEGGECRSPCLSPAKGWRGLLKRREENSFAGEKKGAGRKGGYMIT